MRIDENEFEVGEILVDGTGSGSEFKVIKTDLHDGFGLPLVVMNVKTGTILRTRADGTHDGWVDSYHLRRKTPKVVDRDYYPIYACHTVGYKRDSIAEVAAIDRSCNDIIGAIEISFLSDKTFEVRKVTLEEIRDAKEDK